MYGVIIKCLNEKIDDLQKENKRLQMVFDEKDETIHELQTVLKFRTDENKELYKENNRLKEVIEIKDGDRLKLVEENKNLKRCLTTANNDYNYCYAENIRLAEENGALKFRIKMLTKCHLNSIYGIAGTVYVDTDSIKETKDNDSDN